jgi:hypothetical protein
MNEPQLTTQMSRVIDALSSGANLTDAAAQAGVHRNTIANWRSNSPAFRQALAQAQSDRELLYRERAEALADLAFDSLREILKDPKASPSVRLKAAMFIIQMACGQTPPKARKLPIFKNFPNATPDSNPSAPQPKQEEAASPEKAANLHKNAQPQPYRRPEPKIGRNEPCPCGSGKKYKRCCLDKPHTAAA